MRFLDYVPALYASATLFVFPSRFEGFGLPPLEAMACGTPVIRSDAASLSEVVGEARPLVPPNDPTGLAQAIHRAWTDAHLRAHLRAAGLIRAQAFTWERTARATLDVYERVRIRQTIVGPKPGR